MLTTSQIRSQIARLTRWRRGLCRDYTIAYLGNDKESQAAIWAKYRLITGLIQQLRQELAEFESLSRAQKMAVAEVERLLEL